MITYIYMISIYMYYLHIILRVRPRVSINTLYILLYSNENMYYTMSYLIILTPWVYLI